ncbi:DUF222 domain-containing protein [Mycobacterium malmoense]|uniref:DUF222 domain-containing protein n=1 Tax=Mycobacterium malmoense TaxID=1780 RepID=UPI0008F93C8E|nr:DUF222 domain-containing protein [Mycobacterium malmoense]OIN82622.1 hypothetical protein BMG05_01295 [Mycobacterium malmoense]
MVDEALAADATHFGPLSVTKTAAAIDAVVDRHDPAALRRGRAGARGRHVAIGPADNDSPAASLWGSLLITDATVLDRRLTHMAERVCQDDPRTLDQRRADALGALAAGAENLACGCGSAQCRAGADPRAAAVVIHVVADAAALKAHPAPHLSGAGTIPASMLAELIGGGAKTQPLRHTADAPPEPGSRPLGPTRAVHPLPRYDLPVSRLRPARRIRRHRPHHRLPARPTHPSNVRSLCRYDGASLAKQLVEVIG